MEKTTHRALTVRQRALVEALADPSDGRPVTAKAEAVGYTPRYGYALARKPHVAAEIEKRTNEHLALLRARSARVLSVLADKAEAGDVKAACAFLEAVGILERRGVAVSVTTNAGLSDAEREARILGARSLAERLAANHAERFRQIGGGVDGLEGDGLPDALEDRRARLQAADGNGDGGAE